MSASKALTDDVIAISYVAEVPEVDIRRVRVIGYVGRDYIL